MPVRRPSLSRSSPNEGRNIDQLIEDVDSYLPGQVREMLEVLAPAMEKGISARETLLVRKLRQKASETS